ncbi:hypothetical protein HU200_024412 [Digitaria exilis]|uniref:Uncharacterized protein n=1 Tax=Digitaria exilis TaxID=1010633 RepID=A0A835C2L7_9POAL|nr:hypothetical protein HU200_024412 [Digitaria exilis]
MEETQAAMTAHLDQMSGLVQALSSELRRGMGPAADNLRAFVRAVDWMVSPPSQEITSGSPKSRSLFSLPFEANKYYAPRCALNAQLFQEPWLLCLMAFHVILLLTAVGFRRNANFQLLLLLLACPALLCQMKSRGGGGCSWHANFGQDIDQCWVELDVYDWKCGTWFLDLPFFYLAHDLYAADSGVYMAEKINRYLGEHWKSFAGQNYFDRPGVFISVVWSGPLIFISIVSVVSKNMLALMLSFCLLCRNAYLQFSLWCLYDYVSTLLPFQVSTLIALCRLMVKWKRAELRHRARLARDKQE